MFKKENFEWFVMFVLVLASILWCFNIPDTHTIGLLGSLCLLYIEHNCVLKDDKNGKPQLMFWLVFISFIIIWVLYIESFTIIENVTFFVCSILLLFDRIVDFKIKTNPVYINMEDKDENRTHAN